MDMALNRRVYSRVGFALFLQLALSALLQIGAQALVSYLGYQIETGSWAYYLVAMLPQYLIAMPLAAVVIAHIPVAQGIEKRDVTRRQFIIIALICLFLMYAGNLAGTVISLIISLLAGNEMTNLLAELVSKSDMWVSAVVMVLVAPVVEELFFRKLLIGRLRGYGQRAAVVVSAVAFGLSHGNLSQVFYAFGLGLAFGYIYIHTNRIGYTIALHMIINFLGGVIAPLVMNAGMIYVSVYGMLMLAGVIVGIIQFIKYKRQIGFSEELIIGRPDAWKKPAFLNAGMLVFFAACAALFALNTYWALQPT